MPRSALLVLAAALGCSTTPQPTDARPDHAPLPGLVPGLVRIAQVEQPDTQGHLGDFVVVGSVAYVANNFELFTTYAIEPDGSMFATQLLPAPDGTLARCTALAAHPSSSTLYCASDDGRGLRTYDLSMPEAPRLRDAAALDPGELYVRDLHVVGDTLYLARFDRGLATASIGADGSLGALLPTAITGDVRFVDGEAPLVALSAEHGLVVVDGSGTDASIARTLALEGPVLDLSVRDGLAVVALGSEGVVIVELASLETVVRVVPAGVATSADLDGDALVVTTLTGAYLYDLRGASPRLAGFVRAGLDGDQTGGALLRARFVGGEILASDFRMMDRFAYDVRGDVLEVDAVGGFYVAEGEDVELPFRNEGGRTLRVELDGGLAPATLLPGETAHVTLEAATVAALAPNGVGNRTVHGRTLADGNVVSSWDLAVLLRPDVDRPPSTRPAPGDRVGDFVFARADDTTESLSALGVRTRVVFYVTDCNAMWPVLADDAYLASVGRLDDGATPLFLFEGDVVADGWTARWRLDPTFFAAYGRGAPPTVPEHNGSETLYEDHFALIGLPRGASHPTDYLLDEDGVVLAVEIAARGAHPLR